MDVDNVRYIDTAYNGLNYTDVWNNQIDWMEVSGITVSDLAMGAITGTDSPNVSHTTIGPRPRQAPNNLSGEVRIPLYSLIFLLSVVGNTLVIVTLAQNRRMRTVTNVFLLNLSISDLLLAVFCMPFTLIPTLLRNFIFGKTMCVLIRYLQGE